MTEKDTKIDVAIRMRLIKYPRIITRYYNSLIDSGKTYGTAKTYMQSIFQFLDYSYGDYVPDDFFYSVSENDISFFLDSLKARSNPSESASASAKAAVWSALMSLFTFVSTECYYGENPVTKVPRPSLDKKADEDFAYLTPVETRTLLQAIEREANPRFICRDKSIFMLGLYCGLRINDILALNVDDVDLENRTIRIIDPKKGDRFVSMSEAIERELVCWINDRNDQFEDIDTDALFISQLKVRLSPDMVQKMLNKYSTGIKKRITPRVLRNTFAVNLYARTGDVLLCAKYLDHASIATTQRYVEQVIACDKNLLNIDELYD